MIELGWATSVGPLDVSEDSLRDRVEPVATGADEFGIGLPVSPARLPRGRDPLLRPFLRWRPAGAPPMHRWERARLEAFIVRTRSGIRPPRMSDEPMRGSAAPIPMAARGGGPSWLSTRPRWPTSSASASG